MSCDQSIATGRQLHLLLDVFCPVLIDWPASLHWQGDSVVRNSLTVWPVFICLGSYTDVALAWPCLACSPGWFGRSWMMFSGRFPSNFPTPGQPVLGLFYWLWLWIRFKSHRCAGIVECTRVLAVIVTCFKQRSLQIKASDATDKIPKILCCTCYCGACSGLPQ